jgi:CRISPR-associated protein Csm3
MANPDPTITHKQLVKKIFINGRIRTVTGLHIGGSNTQLEIGGIDNAAIQHPFTGEPYVPGSSLKGKMRSLMEQAEGSFGGSIGRGVNHGPSSDPTQTDLVMLFGNANGDENNIPSRLIVRDGGLLDKELFRTDSELPFTEVKTEVAIDRLTSTATPRQIERVPAGASFSLQLVINVWQDLRGKQTQDEANQKSKKKDSSFFFPELTEARLVELTLNSLRMLQDDYLGGKGSRGSGQISVHLDEIKERSAAFYQGKTDHQEGYQASDHQIPSDLSA